MDIKEVNHYNEFKRRYQTLMIQQLMLQTLY